MAVRIAEANPLASSGRIDLLDSRGAFQLGGRAQVFGSSRFEGDSAEAGLAGFGDVKIGRGVGASRIQSTVRSSVDQLMNRVKVAQNIDSILGPGNSGVHSELWAVNATYLAF